MGGCVNKFKNVSNIILLNPQIKKPNLYSILGDNPLVTSIASSLL